MNPAKVEPSANRRTAIQSKTLVAEGAFRRDCALSLVGESLWLLLLLAAASPLGAQQSEVSDSVRHRNNCRLAEQAISTGRPSPHSQWAWQYIGVCEPRQKVRVYLTAMQQARTSTDLNLMRRAILPAVGFRDSTLFMEILEIAGDRSASVPARVVAFVALAAIRDPSSAPSYEGFVGGLDEHGTPRGRCSRRRGHQIGYHQGPTPLPSDYVQRITALRDRVRLDASEPADVRSAAACT